MKNIARPRLLVLALYVASAALVTVQQAILRHSNNVSIFRSASLVMVVHDVDVVPRWVKYDFLVPYRIKGIPCLVAWFVMQWELLVTARSTARIDTGSFSPPASAAGA